MHIAYYSFKNCISSPAQMFTTTAFLLSFALAYIANFYLRFPNFAYSKTKESSIQSLCILIKTTTSKLSILGIYKKMWDIYHLLFRLQGRNEIKKDMNDKHYQKVKTIKNPDKLLFKYLWSFQILIEIQSNFKF